MRKFVIITIPIVTLTLFILIMNSDNLLKNTFGKDDNIPLYIQLVKQAVQDGKWEEAYKETNELSRCWKKISKRIQFIAEKDEINAIDVNISRLQGAILAKDRSNAFMELEEAYGHWEGIGK